MVGIIKLHSNCDIYHTSNEKNLNSVAKFPKYLYKDFKNRYPKEITEVTDLTKAFNPSKEHTLEEMKREVLISVVPRTIPLDLDMVAFCVGCLNVCDLSSNCNRTCFLDDPRSHKIDIMVATEIELDKLWVFSNLLKDSRSL